LATSPIPEGDRREVVMSRAKEAAEGQLIVLEEARQRLATVQRVDEAAKIRNIAAALGNYAKQQKLGLESQNKAAEIKIRAERRIGELTQEKAPKEQRREQAASVGESRKKSKPKSSASSSKRNAQAAQCATALEKVCEEAGINKDLQRRCETVAVIPEEQFEVMIATAKDQEKELTTAAAVRLGKKIQAEEGMGGVNKEARNGFSPRFHRELKKLAEGTSFLSDEETLKKAKKMKSVEREEAKGILQRIAKEARSVVREL
jgi:hypothetical protein